MPRPTSSKQIYAVTYPGHSEGGSDAGRARQREVAEAFLRAARAGDIEGLLAVLDPDAVVRIDAAARIDGVVCVDVAASDVGTAREVRAPRRG